MGFVIRLVNTIFSFLSLLVIVYVLLGYFLSPYHPVRRLISQIVEPMLTPIRKVVPPINGIDLSPLILIILLQVIGTVLISLLRRLW
jgi:YggT family protein